MHRSKMAAAALLAMLGASASADTILGAKKAVVSSGGPGTGRLADTYNQAGLFYPYVSGETDFDHYIASNPAHSGAGGRWFSGAGGAASVTYDLAATHTIRALALWNEDHYGIGAFNVLYSTDGVFFVPLLTGKLPTNNPAGINYAPDVYGFRPTSMRYVRIDMFACPQAGAKFPLCGLGEIAFAAVAPGQRGAAAYQPAKRRLFEQGAHAIVTLQHRVTSWWAR